MHSITLGFPQSDLAKGIQPVGRGVYLVACLFATVQLCLIAPVISMSNHNPWEIIAVIEIQGITGLWFGTLKSRLSDAGMPDWSVWAFFGFCLLAFFFGETTPLLTQNKLLLPLSIFALLALPTFMPGKPSSQNTSIPIIGPGNGEQQPRGELTVSRKTYLIAIVVLACLANFLALMTSSGNPIDQIDRTVLIAGSVLLASAFFIFTVGRLTDMIHPHDWFAAHYALMFTLGATLLVSLNQMSAYSGIALGAGLLLALAIPPSKPLAPAPELPANLPTEPEFVFQESVPPYRPEALKVRFHQHRNRVASSEPLGPIFFLSILSTIDVLWVYFVQLIADKGNSVLGWGACLGLVVVAFFWLAFSLVRLQEVSAPRFYTSLFYLIVLVPSLLPLIFGQITRFGFIAIFTITQLPLILLPSKPRASETKADMASSPPGG